ncbi:putative acyltransferase [Arcticibacter pallidicorallinus]|uniref:Putative acyltransferase n=1 Tax=Arcticibacter pallidicorallinus TaxID=1259464 RepID=A0A2T0U628_9SPHI|nr:DUF5009 domain-containing protein [Arcticibacter pallidicorallinus]PRY53342.1 putative acyltransferase [Arcticibacter pallidicorallinus]
MALPNNRLLSLDAFRGLTVAAMILVNNPGSWAKIYPPLKHAEWHGCTPTDLVFPFFLFIVGVAIVFALQTKKTDPGNHNQLLIKAAKRGCILFLLGLLLALYPKFNFETVRIMGVLQRIGVVYFICAAIFIKTKPKTQFIIMTSILVVYWILMTFVPVPGFGAPNLEKETNLAAWADRLILTENHTWKSSKTWDPEGILSTMPAVATGLFGMLIGGILKNKEKSAAERTAWLFSFGFIAWILGMTWGLFFPINKSLWTSSYVLYCGGLASMGLALFYWVIDVQGHSRWCKIFVAYGVNAITVFFLSAVIAKTMGMIKLSRNGEEVNLHTWLYKTFFTSWLPADLASLAWALTFVLLFLLLLWPMYKKNWIIKV